MTLTASGNGGAPSEESPRSSGAARRLTDGALFTDHYQLTMAQLYFRLGLADRPALFEHFFRRYPDYGSHQAGFCVTAGLDWALDWMEGLRVGDDELTMLRATLGPTGRPLFHDDFLDWLGQDELFGDVSIRAVPEGRVVHMNTPLAVIRGPLAACQILETAFLNQMNFQTLIATKAARVAEAARRRPVLEFGLRRSADMGGNAASRAALIGGAAASSNVGVSHRMGVAPKGTHAHSMVQAFLAMGEGELGAFRAFAEVYPDECLLLVDTIDTINSGIPNALVVFDELRAAGHEPVGVRLDSGDLAYLAVQAARLLDDAGYPDASIVLSSGLDELLIMQILSQIDLEAARYGVDARSLIDRLVFGVGSKLSTSDGQPYLDGVYKLVALGDNNGGWSPAIKISETTAKTQNPGDKDLYRVYDERGRATADLVAPAGESVGGPDLELQHPTEVGVRRTMLADTVTLEPLLEPVLRDGRRLAAGDPLDVMRNRCLSDLDRLDPGVRRLVNPHRYHVSVTPTLWELKQRLIREAAGG